MNGWVWAIRKATKSRSKLAASTCRWIYAKLESTLGFYIPPSVGFVGEPYFPHGIGGVYISSHSRIGRDAIILQQVTIGSSTLIDSRRMGSPWIGDRCYIGAGAKIVGAVSIGNDVRIGANAVVTVDVPSNATVIGNNIIIGKEAPRDNRHWRYSNGQWEAVNGSGVTRATSEEAEALDAAFRRGQSLENAG